MIPLAPGYPADLFGAFEVMKTRQRLGIDDLKMLALLESAGEAFYLAVAKGVSNTQAKELLIRNGNEERGHAHRILKAIKLLGGEVFTLPEHEENPFVASVLDEYPVNVDFLSMLEEGEKDGDRVYQGWAATEPNADVAKIYRQNGSEEAIHGERVIKAIQFLASN
ncbi:MAG: ferritin family protein [Sterolibacterium sp.]